jgi:DNA ligase 1
MKFSKLANYFEKLEETSSRLILIDILSDLFKNTDKEEVDKIIYLTQGRIAPFFAPVEIGMADKTVADALGRAFGESKDAVLKMYSKAGDIGLVAKQLSEKNQTKSSLTVDDVFKILTEIAGTSGAGTVEKRIILLSDLLKKVDPVSAKHLVRVPLGKTRLGIGDPTILDSLAKGILGDRANRKLLEKAYNETSDLGLIGKTLLTDGLEEVQKLTVTVGRPIRSELCERLPNPVKVFEKMGEKVHATPKYDGFRVQIHKDGNKVSMYSRNLEDMTHMFPELIEGTLKQVNVKTAILDTEALAYQPESEEFLPFQETTKRRRKHGIEAMVDTPLHERVRILKKVVDTGDTLLEAPGEILTDPKDLQLMLDDSISKGLEGVVVKKIDSLYEAGGRNFNWVKLKRHSSGELHDTIDCVILGYIFGKGKRTAFGAGALLVGIYDKDKDEFVTVSKIGTGLSDDEWKSIKEKTKGMELSHKPARTNSLIEPSVWVKPEIVIEVLADEITRSPLHTAGLKITDGVKEPGYALRFPRLVTFRDKDKKPEDATTVEELIEMYNQQGKK